MLSWQNQSIPDSIWRHNKGAIIDTQLPDHDNVQAMTAVKVWHEMDCSKSVGHHCIWYDPASNSYTEQNDPCVWLILGILMSQGLD